MNKPVNKCVLVGVSGGIAAYKSPDLVRRLREHGADVRVAMTQNAHSFISSLTLQAVSGHAVHDRLLDSDAESGMDHIELARWADLIIIAPASADCIARLAHGLADDLLTTVCLASEAKLYIAPAMNQQMWQHAATQENCSILTKRGAVIVGPGIGDQACGETGPGRMLEPSAIVNRLQDTDPEGVLQNVNVTVTAGPTWEALDPVRGITNHSSGKMGYAIAQAARQSGANVTLVSGPCSLETPANVERIDVVSATEMLEAVDKHLTTTDVFIGVAAVSDYRPVMSAKEKIKKDAQAMTIELVQNPDILSFVSKSTRPPFSVGFAAETENVLKNARTKLQNKGVDLIVANQVGNGKAFGADENHLILIDQERATDLGNGPKIQLAQRLVEQIAERFHAKNKS